MSTPPTRWGVSDAAGAPAAIAKLAATSTRPRAVLFTATPVNGVPWCPDCARTLAGIRKAVTNAGGVLLEVEVSRPEWKDPATPSPLRAAYGLSGIPSLALLNDAGGVERVLGPELERSRDEADAEVVVGRWLKAG